MNPILLILGGLTAMSLLKKKPEPPPRKPSLVTIEEKIGVATSANPDAAIQGLVNKKIEEIQEMSEMVPSADRAVQEVDQPAWAEGRMVTEWQ
jgi:hypothetical protein